MFPNEITLTIATVPYVLSRINQDNFGSEYRFKDATGAIALKIRHSTDSVDKDGVKMDRHNVFVEQVVYATPTAAMKKFTSTSTFRCGSTDDPALLVSLAKAVNVWLASGTVIADLSVGKN